MSKAGDMKVAFDGAGADIAADTAGQAFKPLTLKLPAAAESCKAGAVTDAAQVPCPKPKSVEPKREKTVEEKSVNEILSGLNPQQRLVFFESLTFNKEGKIASFYTKDIKEVLGEKALIDVLKKFADKRKTTLYRALEILLNIQTDYLATGEPGRRRPLSQKTLAKNLEVHPSVLNRLVSNKSTQLPWGTEAPMSVLLPSAKEVNLERLYSIAAAKPELSDEKLRAELKARHGIDLSRRSVAQYRKEMSLAAAQPPIAPAPEPSLPVPGFFFCSPAAGDSF
jgi:plasmid maintenance system antidote protein VapI